MLSSFFGGSLNILVFWHFGVIMLC